MRVEVTLVAVYTGTNTQNHYSGFSGIMILRLRKNEMLAIYCDNEVDRSMEIKTDGDGTDWFQGVAVCEMLEVARPTEALHRIVDTDYRRKFTWGKQGAPAWYVTEPGLYQLLFASKSAKARLVQRWVFEEVLPKLRKDRYYIDPTINSEQLTRLQSEIDELKAQIQDLEHRNKVLHENRDLTALTADFMRCNFDFFPANGGNRKYIVRSSWTERFNLWYNQDCIQERYKGLGTVYPEAIAAEMDRQLKAEAAATRLPQDMRIFFLAGYADLENAAYFSEKRMRELSTKDPRPPMLSKSIPLGELAEQPEPEQFNGQSKSPTLNQAKTA